MIPHFSSYCTTHRSNQDLSVLPKQQQQQQQQEADEECSSYPCPLCLDEVVYDKQDVLKTPCCKNIFIHRPCVQVRINFFVHFYLGKPLQLDSELFSMVFEKYLKVSLLK